MLHWLPFWATLSLVPAIVFAAANGGWALVLPPFIGWVGYTLLDFLTGQSTENLDPQTPESKLVAYRALTLIWFPVQFALLFGMIGYVTSADHLVLWEKFALFFGVGVASGTIGINFSHELMHRPQRLDRWLADLLLATVMYSHFRTEHLLVHHTFVGTPKDAVTARYNEGFARFFPRVLWQCLRSAWRTEADRCRRKGKPKLDPSNPFWRYWALQAGFVFLALIIGGWLGLALFFYQAFIAVWQLELVNYIEHYGLTRRQLPNGKFEPIAPRHSWNSNQTASNWLLINLQRHSDHHYKPARPYPLLQTYTDSEAPNLPFGYPLMTVIAMWPPAWRRFMNPRVRKWRAMFYPEITDWAPTNHQTQKKPLPGRQG